jgi:hypothetical protein
MTARTWIALALLVPLPGCGLLSPLGCAAVGWYEGLTIQLEGMSALGLPGGRYDITVVADGVMMAFDLDLTGGANPCPEGTCKMSAPASVGRALDVRVTPGNGTVQLLYTSGGGPSEVTIAVTWQDREVGSATFRPSYEHSEPNGDGCGVATTATETLQLDVPAPTLLDAGR